MRGCKPSLCVAASVFALGIGLAAQEPLSPADAYSAAVGAYVETGNPAKAATSLRRWSKDQFASAINAQIKRGDTRLIEAAAILQLEIGVSVVQLSPPAAMGYLELGHTLLAALPTATPDHIAVRSKWYAVATSAFLMMSDAAHARVWVGRGLRIAPSSPTLQTMAGMLEEVRASLKNPKWFDRGARRSRMARESRAHLAAAEHQYRSVLTQDPAFVLARVRLGRALWLLDNASEARTVLERASADAKEPSHAYEAALFLGEILQHQNELTGARESYEQALAIRPTSQAATIALGYLAVMAGRPDQAQALARAFAADSETDTNWWTQRNGGLDLPALAWLRSRVRP